jgi:hypothetical protein
MRAGTGVPVDNKGPDSSMAFPRGKGTADDSPRGKDSSPCLAEGRIEVEHGGKLAGHRVPSKDENPPLLAVQLRLLSLTAEGLRRAPDRIKGAAKLSTYYALGVSSGSSLGD